MEPIHISFARGKGKLRHNNRDMISDNVNRDRIKDNIIFVQMPVREAYEKIFGQAQEEYNAKQTRKSRKIDNYFNKLFPDQPNADDLIVHNNNKQQSYYEWVIGVGDKNTMGYEKNPNGANTAEIILKEYMEGFQSRNPNFFVFNAVMHRDEATPHIHFDMIPFADGYKTGMSRQQGIAKALETMGYGTGKNAIADFTVKERQIFREICQAHGIEPVQEQKGRGYSFTVEEYKAHKDKISEYELIEEKLSSTIKKDEEILRKNKIISLGLDSKLSIIKSILKETDVNLDKKKASLNEVRSEYERITSEYKNLLSKKGMISNEIATYEKEKEELIAELNNLKKFKEEKIVNEFNITPRPKLLPVQSENEWKLTHNNFKGTLLKSAEKMQHEAYLHYAEQIKTENEIISQQQKEWDTTYKPFKIAKEILEREKDLETIAANITSEIERRAQELASENEKKAIIAQKDAETRLFNAIDGKNIAIKEKDKAIEQRNQAVKQLKGAEDRGYIKAKEEFDSKINKIKYNLEQQTTKSIEEKCYEAQKTKEAAIEEKNAAIQERDDALNKVRTAEERGYNKAKAEYEAYIEAYEEYTDINRSDIEEERDDKLGYNISGMSR